MEYKQAIKNRRSHYAIKKSSIITESKIIENVEYALKHTPSAFNVPCQAVAVLFGICHEQLWTITMETLRKIIPKESFAKTEEKIRSFGMGYGTVLFFNDEDVIRDLQSNYTLYKDNFPIWAEQSVGMLQSNVWTMLEIEGLGASLQHYNPLIDEEVKRFFDVPKSWKLVAQMPFGDVITNPDEKEFADYKSRMKIYKGDTMNGNEDRKINFCSPETDDCMHQDYATDEEVKQTGEKQEEIACSPEFNGCIGSQKE